MTVSKFNRTITIRIPWTQGGKLPLTDECPEYRGKKSIINKF